MTIPNSGKDMEHLEFSSTDGNNAKCYSHIGIQPGGWSKHTPTMRPSDPTPRHVP